MKFLLSLVLCSLLLLLPGCRNRGGCSNTSYCKTACCDEQPASTTPYQAEEPLVYESGEFQEDMEEGEEVFEEAEDIKVAPAQDKESLEEDTEEVTENK